MSENIKKESKINLKIIILVFLALLGTVFLLYGSFSDNRKNSDGKDTENKVEQPKMSEEEYVLNIEKQISELCNTVEGVGYCKVAVTLNGGYNALYAQNFQSGSQNHRSEYVMIGSGQNEHPILIGYTVPQISGVGIVCVGGGNSQIKIEIISLVSAAFSVSSNKIYVTEAKS